MASTAVVVANVLSYVCLLTAFIVLTIKCLKYKVRMPDALARPALFAPHDRKESCNPPDSERSVSCTSAAALDRRALGKLSWPAIILGRLRRTDGD